MIIAGRNESTLKITPLKIDGLYLVEPVVHQDSRGFFLESYNEDAFLEHGLDYRFVQDNHSLSCEAGVTRGLHYQLNPKAQTKLVRVTAGAIYDVAVDIRKDSKTFGQWIGVILSEENKRQLLVPKGFAHGFCTLITNTQVMYKVDNYYSPEHDRGIIWNDKDLNIDWPVSNPILSEKDKNHPEFRNSEINF